MHHILLPFHHIFASQIQSLWWYYGKNGKVTSDESRVIHPSTRKVVFLTYKFSLSSSSSINNPGLVMLVFLHCLPRENPRHRAQETFLCLLPKPQQQMLSVCFHNLKIYFFCSLFSPREFSGILVWHTIFLYKFYLIKRCVLFCCIVICFLFIFKPSSQDSLHRTEEIFPLSSKTWTTLSPLSSVKS